VAFGNLCLGFEDSPIEVWRQTLVENAKTIEQIKARYSNMIGDLSENWTRYVGAFSDSALGFSVSGNLNVNPSVVTVELALPLLAIAFRGQIEAGICNELTTLLV
jgi:hypothetical protein